MLRQRGEEIEKEDLHEARVVEERITAFVERKHDFWEKPFAAFVTFEEEEGKSRALLLKEKTWFGHPLKFRRACEPKDIIWENSHVSHC